MNATAFVSGKVLVWLRMRSLGLVMPVIVLGLLLYVGCGSNNSSSHTTPRSRTYAGSGSLFVSDFNQDGKPDLLTSDGTMNIGQGDGTFVTGTHVTLASGLSVVAVADFNGDRKPDLLVANPCTSYPCGGSTTSAVLMGNGDGTFQTGATFSLSAAGLENVAVADLNGDGNADVVAVLGDGTVQVYLNDGGGTFASGVPYISGATLDGELALGDFNGDGLTDITVSTSGNDPNAQFGGEQLVLLGNGDGTFQAAKSSLGTFEPSFAAIADFNRDGNLDLAVADCNLIYGCAVYIFLGVGNGTFQLPSQLYSGTPPLEGTGPIAVGDFNGDGKWDLIVENPALGSQVSGQIFLGNDDGTFPKTTTYSVDNQSGQASLWMAIADFNGDGKSDIAVDNDILLGNGDGTFQGKTQ